MVVNAPTSNIVSAAELTVGHILSLARHIPQASAALKDGEWKRSKYTGIELFEKKIGIIGLGRIGALVAARLKGFDTKILAYDPYITSARAAQLGVQLVTLDELLAQSDFISIHMPKTPETVGMLGAESFKKMKSTAYVVNVARGGLVDEEALYAALRGRRNRRRRRRRLRQGAQHRPAVLQAGQRGGHPAPGRVHGRSPGKGRRLGRQVRPPGPGRGTGSRRRQRRRRRHRPGRPPGHPADGKAGPHLHRADARLADPVRRRGCRRNLLAGRQGARTRGAQGHLRRRRDRAGLLRQRPRDRRAARHQRPPDHDAGHRVLPQRPDPARRPERRHADLRGRNPDRAQAGPEARRRSTATRWRSRSANTSWWSPTRTAPA